MKLSLTIGISALNEEGNIGYLVQSLLKQKFDNIKLDKIIVQSDGSTDKTSEIVRSIKSAKVHLIDNKKRAGLAHRYNQLIKLTNSDVLVLLNADILPKNDNFIKNLVAPVVTGKADMTAAKIEPVKPSNFFENMIAVSMQLKDEVFDQLNKGDNIYTCHGPARAFNKAAYSKMRFPDSVGEDAFSYLYVVSKGLKFKYVKNSVAIYKLPDNFKDHRKQSVRFQHSITRFQPHFDSQFIERQYMIDYPQLAKTTLKYCMKYPLEMISYLVLTGYLKVDSMVSGPTANQFQTASSSKVLLNGGAK